MGFDFVPVSAAAIAAAALVQNVRSRKSKNVFSLDGSTKQLTKEDREKLHKQVRNCTARGITKQHK
jgi:ABC-type sugar transport system ATPase subunit